ncbi:putative RNA recognition motif domain, nucleotide-binding alpha-beta plait domain superfamily [Helianthus annuus]|nr:putative RNA recognition motif domain, nucleotide-binding alpha-beta plait domain superfamily [Helianthus annuus]
MAGRWKGDAPYNMYSGYSNGRQVTTFFVTNLPDGVTQSLLWTAFMPHGVVKDAYVAKKRDVRGNYFGFVRIEGVTEMDKVLKGMNTIKIYDAKLTVSVARFGKHHKQNVKPNGYRPLDYRYKVNNAPPAGVYIPKPVLNKGLFSEVVAGATAGASSSKKRIIVEGKAALYPDHCIMRSVIGDVKDVTAFGSIKNMLKESGFSECSVGYIGGLKVMIVFKDKKSAVEFVTRKKEAWEQILSSPVLWEGQHVEVERVACLKVVGMPLQLRDPKFFDRIGELFGSLVSRSEFSWQQVDNATGFSWVLTSTTKRIDEEVEVVWGERQFKVWVVEVDNKSFDCVIEELSSDEKGSPVEYADSVVGVDDDVEEGEIRKSDVGGNDNIPAPVPAPEDDTPEMEADVEEGGESEAEGDGLHGESVDCEELHGENSNIEGEANESQIPIHVEHACEKTQPQFDLNKSIGSFSVGSTKVESVNKSRKRPRRCRSPSHEEFCGPEGQSDGPTPNRNPLHELIKKSKVISVEPNPASFIGEQNNVTVNGGDTEEIPGQSEVSGGFNIAGDSQCRSTHLGTRQVSEPAECVAEADASQAKRGNGESIADEVLATMEVGKNVGFQMEGFMNQVSELVMGEGGQNPIQ